MLYRVQCYSKKVQYRPNFPTHVPLCLQKLISDNYEATCHAFIEKDSVYRPLTYTMTMITSTYNIYYWGEYSETHLLSFTGSQSVN